MTPPSEVPQITSGEIQHYLEGLQGYPDPLLEEMEASAAERGFPRLAPVNARLLALLVKATGASAILELGSGFGWSALWMARSMPEGGRILLTDRDPALLEEAATWFDRAGLSERAEYLAGDALQVLEQSDAGIYDLIFIDIDKSAYLNALEKAVPRLRVGGLLCVDNALWHGLVAASDAPGDETTAAVMAFGRAVSQHPGLEGLILPAGDGLAVSVKVVRE